MIEPSVLERATEWRTAFDSARPFKHVCIDDFFLVDTALQLLQEFPKFDEARALNEFGTPTGKHVVTEMAAVSPLYAETYNFLRSGKFLQFMSDITGVEGLLFDDTMYGGGTHENVDGQSLAPHVDFNYDQRTGWHRRLNALLYLNPLWEESWGGCIELHKNPRQPDTDESIAYLPLMNRMVIFETNEHSWHGFQKINLPARYKAQSRKCLSIYLYTKTRSAEETVAPHGTFYVHPPLSKKFTPGYVLTSDDVAELKSAFRIRDIWIEAYQKGTIKSAADTLRQKDALEQASSNQRVNLSADQCQLAGTKGVFHDGWLAPEVQMRFDSRSAVKGISLAGQAFEESRLKGVVVKTAQGVDIVGEITTMSDGYGIALPQVVKGSFTIELEFARVTSGGLSGDLRPLCFNLHRIELLSEVAA